MTRDTYPRSPAEYHISTREAQDKRPSKIPTAKLEAFRASMEHSFPVADIESMNREIEQLQLLIFIDSSIPM